MDKEQHEPVKDEKVEVDEMDKHNIPEDELEEQEVEQEVVEEASISNDDYQKLMQEHEETQERLLRVQAEYDNFRKRTQREKEASLKYKSQDVIEEILPVMDNFERALQVEAHDEASKNIIQGIEM